MEVNPSRRLQRWLTPGLLGIAPALAAAAWSSLHGASELNWEICLILACAALLGWLYSYRRYRQYADTPICTQIESAPQGYVALEGIGRALPGDVLRSPLNYLPCLWFRIRIEVLDGRKRWRVESDERSDDAFILEDRNGTRCTVDPTDAQIETRNCDRVLESDRRVTQWLLLPGTRIHVLGDFRSRRPIEDRASANAEVREKLADWKRSGEALARFDADRNGALDLDEWDKVRSAAHDEVLRERDTAADLPAYHLLGAPADGRPFVISDQPPAQLRRQYQRHAHAFLGAFFMLLTLSAWLAHRS